MSDIYISSVTLSGCKVEGSAAAAQTSGGVLEVRQREVEGRLPGSGADL